MTEPEREPTAAELIPGLKFTLNTIKFWSKLAWQHGKTEVGQAFDSLIRTFSTDLDNLTAKAEEEDTQEYAVLVVESCGKCGSKLGPDPES